MRVNSSLCSEGGDDVVAVASYSRMRVTNGWHVHGPDGTGIGTIGLEGGADTEEFGLLVSPTATAAAAAGEGGEGGIAENTGAEGGGGMDGELDAQFWGTCLFRDARV